MNDAQTWTTIGGMFTFMLAFVAIMVRMFGQTMDAKFAAVDTRFDGLTALMVQRFEQVDGRIDSLDRDVEAITRRLWDGPAV